MTNIFHQKATERFLLRKKKLQISPKTALRSILNYCEGNVSIVTRKIFADD